MKRLLSIFSMVVVLLASEFVSGGQMMTGDIIFRKGENGIHTYRIPAVVQTREGTILAFAEARHNSGSDTGDIDLVLKRSTDGGKTWSPIITVWDDKDNTCGNPCPVVDRNTGRIILLSTWNNGKDSEKQINARTSIDTRRVYCLYSDDDGMTWSAPKEITRSAKKKAWTWYATGPCHAIQLTSGRIIVPCDHGNFIGDKKSSSASHVIYSDNGGKTWKMGGILNVGNESTVTELADGRVMLNMRTERTGREEHGYGRLVAISNDYGKTFGEPYYDNGLIEPVCNASIINYNTDGKPGEKLLFSNPETKNKRRNMTIRMSRDSGKYWERACTLTEGPAAYSDLMVFPNGDVGILYECGLEKPYETITFARIPAETFTPEADETVLLYPEGQDSDKGIVENGKAVTLGPGVSNGITAAETRSRYGNVSLVGDNARMELYFPEKPNGQLVVVCPGGGYSTVCAIKEGEDVAKWMNKRGITVCTVVYRLPNGHSTVPLTDVQNAFRYCREHAEEWGISQIGVMGFSAGGHLAASASVFFSDSVTRPDFSILIYPVIDLDHHNGTRKELVGEDAALKEKYCLQHHVSANTPKTFLALCRDDKVVNPKSSLMYYNSLLDNGVSAEMYIFPTGGHGWGFLSEEPGGRKDGLAHYRDTFSECLERFLSDIRKQ